MKSTISITLSVYQSIGSDSTWLLLIFRVHRKHPREPQRATNTQAVDPLPVAISGNVVERPIRMDLVKEVRWALADRSKKLLHAASFVASTLNVLLVDQQL